MKGPTLHNIFDRFDWTTKEMSYKNRHTHTHTHANKRKSITMQKKISPYIAESERSIHLPHHSYMCTRCMDARRFISAYCGGNWFCTHTRICSRDGDEYTASERFIFCILAVCLIFCVDYIKLNNVNVRDCECVCVCEWMNKHIVIHFGIHRTTAYMEYEWNNA